VYIKKETQTRETRQLGDLHEKDLEKRPAKETNICGVLGGFMGGVLE